MAQGFGISEIINIDTTISSGGIGPADFGTGLLLVNEDTLSAAGQHKIQRFSSYDDVVARISNETVRREAAIWFAADPSPKALYIARVVEGDLPTEGISAKLDATDITDLEGSNNWKMTINGHSINVNLTSVTGGANIANAIETQLQGLSSDTGLQGSSVTWNSTTGRFTFKLKGASDAAFTEPMLVTYKGSTGDKNLGAKLGFIPAEGEPSFAEGTSITDDIGAYYRQGHLGQGVQQALSEVVGYASGGRPTNIMVSDTVSTTINGASPAGKIAGLRAFTQSGDYITAFIESGESAVFNGSEVTATSQIGLANANNQSKVMAIYSDASDDGTSNRRVDIAVLAKLSSQNFDQPQSIVTLVPKSLPSVAPTNTISNQQLEGLKDANASIYTTVGGYPAFLGGKVSNGTWIDAQYWLAWLKNEMELNIYNAMRQSSRFDNIELTDTIHQVMAKAFNTGGIKLGGVVNAAIKKEIRIVTNNPGFDGVLQNGYLLYITPYSSLTDLDRSNRNQNFKVWISPSEAIHSVAGTIVLNG